MRKPLWLLFTISFCIPALVNAVDQLELSVAKGIFKDIRADNLSLVVNIIGNDLGFVASADRIELARPIGHLKKVQLQCNKLKLVSKQVLCSQGSLKFEHEDIGRQTLAFNLLTSADKVQYQFMVSGLKIALATISLTLMIEQQGWQVSINAPELSIDELFRVISPYLTIEQKGLLSEWEHNGKLNLDITASGVDKEVNNFDMAIHAKELSISDSQGLFVAEDVNSIIHLSGVNELSDWQWISKISLDKGQTYVEPIFLDFTETPFEVRSEGNWSIDKNRFHISSAELIQKAITQLSITAAASDFELEFLNIKMKTTELEKLYEIWIKPYTLGTSVDSLQLTGQVSINYSQQGDNYHLSTMLEKVFIADQINRFSLDELSGRFGWSNYDRQEQINVRWERGSLYALPLGASRFMAKVANSSIELQQEWSLPILDGVLKISNFHLQQLEDALPEWTFSGELTPISMASLSTSLKWPMLHGKLSGVIPKVSYKKQQIKVDGALKVNLFDGETVIRGLSLEQPFGTLPQLKANITMKDINLETLTQTFEFGKITGKLEGKIHNLRLSNWQPVQFDASFSTPKGDKSRRRVSQKAVDNLSQIGGGATGVLQRSLLRFFEDFSYQKLGFTCQLRNDSCLMSGVEDAKQGFYIIKGGGLPPRIDVIAYTRRVNWPDLIQRLKAVSESDGPIVK